MRVMDWIMALGGLIVAVWAGWAGGWAVGIAALFLYLFIFAMARFAAAMFQRRKSRR
jgi:hypothetical protein